MSMDYDEYRASYDALLAEARARTNALIPKRVANALEVERLLVDVHLALAERFLTEWRSSAGLYLEMCQKSQARCDRLFELIESYRNMLGLPSDDDPTPQPVKH
jgi:hypothetical protein